MAVTVYADILVVVNLYVDFFLLWCVKKFLQLKVKSRRLALGAAIGAVLSLTALLPGLPQWAELLVSVAVSAAVTAATFAPCSPRTLIKSGLCFFAASFLLAGFFLFLLRFFSPKSVAVFGNVIYLDLSPLLLFLFTCAAYLVFSVLQRLLPRGSPGNRYYSILIESGGSCAKIFAKADTGNNLREPFSGLPVIVCEEAAIKHILPVGITSLLKTESEAALPKNASVRLVPFDSIGGRGILPAFLPEKAVVTKTGQELSCYIAVCERKLSAGQFDAVFNPDQFTAAATIIKRRDEV